MEFPDDASRRHWAKALAAIGAAPPVSVVEDPDKDLPAGDPAEAARPADRTRPPTDPDDLATLLRAEHGPGGAAKWTMELYRSYVVPRPVRARVLLILADLDGFAWRGRVTDRAGRRGVAITVTATPPPDNADKNRYESTLIFDPRTGELLAHEHTVLTVRRRPMFYWLSLDRGWTDRLG